MKHLLFLFAWLASTVGLAQNIVEIKPEPHPPLDSIIKAASITDATKSRAMSVVARTAGHRSFHIGHDYALNPSTDGKRLVRDAMTLDEAKARFDDAWIGLTTERSASGALRFTTAQAEARLLNMSMYDAAHMDATWYNSPYIPLAGSRGLLLSNNKITTPLGGWWATIQKDLCYNVNEGEGNFNANDQSGLGGTEIHAWLDKWQDDKANITLMGAFHGGSDNFYAYSEGQQVRNLRLNGHADTTKRAGRTITGLRIWDSGSGSDYGNLFVHHCDEGIDAVRGTPTNFSGSIATFSNTVCGGCFTGGSGSVYNASTWEGDDNGRLFWARPGWGRPAGGMFNFDLVKHECLITPQRFYAPNTIVLDGWVRFNAEAMSVAASWGYLPDLFDLKCDINTSHVEVEDLRVFGGAIVENVYVDRVNNEELDYDNGYGSRIISVDWYSDNGGTVYVRPNAAAQPKPTTRGPGRLAYLKSGPDGRPVGSFDYVATKPSWTDEGGLGGGTGPVLTPCTGWTTGAWGACTNGTQTRTVTATPAGCTGTPANKPAESQSCTVAPKWDSCKDTPACAVNTTTNPRRVIDNSKNPINRMVIKDAVFSNVGFGWVNDRVSISNGKLFLWTGTNTYTEVPGITVVANQKITIDIAMGNNTLSYAWGHSGNNGAKLTAAQWSYF